MLLISILIFIITLFIDVGKYEQIISLLFVISMANSLGLQSLREGRE